MPKANLTDLAIRSLKPSNYTTMWDTQLRGFGVRTGLSSKTWVVMVGKQRRRITVGHYPAMPLKEARSHARTILYRPHYQSPTLDEAIASYAQFHLQPNTKPTTAKETERMLRKHFALFIHRKLADITLQDITAVTNSLRATPTEANMAFTHIRSLLNWATSKQLITTTPLNRARLPYKKAKRRNTLSMEQMRQIYTTSTGQFGTIVKLCILTAQRRTQIGSLQWSWINTDTIVFPAHIMKAGIEHVIPLTSAVSAILSQIPRTSTYVFPARAAPFQDWARAKRALDAQTNITNYVLHDLRRTAATLMAAQGTPPHIIEKILAHVTGSQTDVALTYNRYQYLPEMRKALGSYEQHLFSNVCDGLNIIEPQ